MTNYQHDLINEIREFPLNLRKLIKILSDDQLNKKIENWSSRDIVHHLADTHTVIYVRIKQILTNEPILVRPVNNQAWNALADYKQSVSDSLDIISGIHNRLSHILEGLTAKEFIKFFNHPERGRITFNHYLKTFVNHGKGHIEKIQEFSSKNI